MTADEIATAAELTQCRRSHAFYCYKSDDGTYAIEDRCACGADAWNAKIGIMVTALERLTRGSVSA